MESLNILLLIIIGYVMFMLTTDSTKKVTKRKKIHTVKTGKKSNKSSNNSANSRYINVNTHRYNTQDDKRYQDDVLDDPLTWDDSYVSAVVKTEHVNPNFINTQFHVDYRDLITAFNNIVPDRKQIFNMSNIPLVYSEPEAAEVKNIVSDFIEVVNHNLQTEVPCARNKNTGWDEAISDPNVESGWEKVQRRLGLPTSLYEDDAPKAPVRLIDIARVQKYETDDEIRYSIEMVLQKENVSDQILVKTDMVQDKRPLTDENSFFTSKNIRLQVAVENIFITGFLSRAGDNDHVVCSDDEKHKTKFGNIGSGNTYNINNVDNYDGNKQLYYDYNKLEQNNMTDPKMVQRLLRENYRKRGEEMEQKTSMLDEFGQAYHDSLPNPYDYSNIRDTRSIYDDMNCPKTFI